MESAGQLVLILGGVVVAIVLLIIFVVIASFINTWIQARMSGAPVSFITLLSMGCGACPLASSSKAASRR